MAEDSLNLGSAKLATNLSSNNPGGDAVVLFGRVERRLVRFVIAVMVGDGKVAHRRARLILYKSCGGLAHLTKIVAHIWYGAQRPPKVSAESVCLAVAQFVKIPTP